MSPLYIVVNWDSFSGPSGSLGTGNMSFMFFIAMITVNLALAHEDAPKSVLINVVFLGLYIPVNYLAWSQIISSISPLQNGLQWYSVQIQIGWGYSQGGAIADGVIFFPNWTLIVALALGIMNVAYTWRATHLPSKVQTIE